MLRPGTGPIWPDAGDRSCNSLHDTGVLLEQVMNKEVVATNNTESQDVDGKHNLQEVAELNSVVENGVAAIPINDAAPIDANPTVDAMGYLFLQLKLFEYLRKDDRLYRAHKTVVVEGIQDPVGPKCFVGYTNCKCEAIQDSIGGFIWFCFSIVFFRFC